MCICTALPGLPRPVTEQSSNDRPEPALLPLPTLVLQLNVPLWDVKGRPPKKHQMKILPWREIACMPLSSSLLRLNDNFHSISCRACQSYYLFGSSGVSWSLTQRQGAQVQDVSASCSTQPYRPISNARRRREKATRKITFRNRAAGDVIATAWRKEMTWSQR